MSYLILSTEQGALNQRKREEWLRMRELREDQSNKEMKTLK